MLGWGIPAPIHTDNLHVEIGGQNTLLKPFPQASAALSSSFPLKTLERACGASFLTNLTLSEFPLSLYLNHLTHCALPVSWASGQAVLPFHVFFLAQPLGLAVCSTSFKAKVRYHLFRDILLVPWFTAGPLCVCPFGGTFRTQLCKLHEGKDGDPSYSLCACPGAQSLQPHQTSLPMGSPR